MKRFLKKLKENWLGLLILILLFNILLIFKLCSERSTTTKIIQQKNDSLKLVISQICTMENIFTKIERMKHTLLLAYPKRISTWSYYENGELKHKKIITGVTEFQADIRAYMYYKLVPKGLAWEILPATEWSESMMNATLKSSKDCKGAMQVSESTGEAKAKNIGIPYLRNHSLWNDLDNFEIGYGHLIDGLMEQSHNYSHGIKKYYAGNYIKKPHLREKILSYNNKVMLEYYKLRFLFKGLESCPEIEKEAFSD
jgi:hypothetical protein